MVSPLVSALRVVCMYDHIPKDFGIDEAYVKERKNQFQQRKSAYVFVLTVLTSFSQPRLNTRVSSDKVIVNNVEVLECREG